MSDTIPLVPLPANTWVDVYDATGIAPGTALLAAISSTKSGVITAISLAEPASVNLGVPMAPKSSGLQTAVTAGETGFWAFATTPSKIAVQDAT